MLPACSVTISSIVEVLIPYGISPKVEGLWPLRSARTVALSRVSLYFWNRAACTQTIDLGRAKSELPEDLVVVLSNLRGALRGHLGDAMHLKRAADCGRQLAACTFERNDDVIRPQLGIVDHLLWPAHRSEGHVRAVEHVIPMGHRLGTEDLVKDRR